MRQVKPRSPSASPPPQQLYAHQSAALTPLQVVCVLQRVWQRVLHCVLPVCCSGTNVYVTVPLQMQHTSHAHAAYAHDDSHRPLTVAL